MERGFLQTLPLSFDMRRGEWFSTPGSAVRHFEGVTNEELPWTDRAYTFNASCFGCHVSQLSTNYEPATDSYRTVWAEPGINCETCHGPASEHVKAFEALAPGQKAKDLKIVPVKRLSHEQRNDLCASCHAKASPLWTDFHPGDRFFDHFDLVTLESPDYYPDGRDLGENYTLTSWRMSPCARSGQLDCVHCHTSSGRYKWKDEPNRACLPCHEARVKNAAAHTHHEADGPGSRCTSCHMPMTEFARMRRSDHSMRPPMPAATIAFGSPNACNVCHADKDARWADRTVKAWRGAAGGTWEARTLREGRLVAAARKGDWSQTGAILAYLGEAGRDEIVTTSLIRLLEPCPDPAKWPALRTLADDARRSSAPPPSPPSPSIPPACRASWRRPGTPPGSSGSGPPPRSTAATSPPCRRRSAGTSRRPTPFSSSRSRRDPTSSPPTTTWATSTSTAARPPRPWPTTRRRSSCGPTTSPAWSTSRWPTRGSAR